ncbi:MAG: hypothetical protein AUK34_05475 [Ignavibacteria bacterium CG2_30_36_16]|nr:MAG: hypothetical protein AUK34_05475 [Ignavibacteria bacterium CG2_30_36_16]PJB01554.1 MAG: hypothetical protein CO127_03235 [Ignavibacteria bacterium CG_4_9_14_3_um_filter_36_18]
MNPVYRGFFFDTKGNHQLILLCKIFFNLLNNKPNFINVAPTSIGFYRIMIFFKLFFNNNPQEVSI